MEWFLTAFKTENLSKSLKQLFARRSGLVTRFKKEYITKMGKMEKPSIYWYNNMTIAKED